MKWFHKAGFVKKLKEQNFDEIDPKQVVDSWEDTNSDTTKFCMRNYIKLDQKVVVYGVVTEADIIA